MGEFLKVEVPGHGSGHRFTTREMLNAERANVDFIVRGKNAVEPMMNPDAAARHAAAREVLNDAQRRTVRSVSRLSVTTSSYSARSIIATSAV